MKKEIIVYVDNHFDLMWRRRFEGRLVHKGEAYASYAELEAYYILDNIALARKHPDYKFQIESVAVAKQFCKQYPELTAELQTLQRENRLYIPGAGFCIIDSNMVGGESLVRNYLIGNRWLQQVFGYTPALAVRNDAFGNTAQLPQILRGFGFRWVTGLHYAECKAPYWKGLDGSAVCTVMPPFVGGHGNWSKQVPCPLCKGHGDSACEACGGRGIDMEKAVAFTAPAPIHDGDFQGEAQGLYRVGTEEGLPVADTVRWVSEMEKAYNIHFGFQSDAYSFAAEAIARCDDPAVAADLPVGDLNPVCTGVYVSRIRAKQNVRRHEAAMAAAEALEAMAFVSAGKAYRGRLNRIWEQMLFEMFHDAITGTHVDAAYDELMETARLVDSGIREIAEEAIYAVSEDGGEAVSIINPLAHVYSGVVRVAVPEGKTLAAAQNGAAYTVEANPSDGEGFVLVAVQNLPPFRACRLPLVDGAPIRAKCEAVVADSIVSIQNEFFAIQADKQGLLSIQDKRSGRVVCQAGKYRPGELVLAHDEGSPWATLHPSHTEICLSAYTTLTSYASTGARQYLTFESALPSQYGTALSPAVASVTYTLTAGIAHVDCSATVRWRCANERLRVMFPCTESGRHMYEIPFGMLERPEYTPSYEWAGANGDWAAGSWAGVESTHGSVAIFNKGTPSYCIQDAAEGAVISLSLLRSPILPTYLHEPEVYSMTDWDGMRDEGTHHFAYALASYETPFAENNAVQNAQAYNAVPPTTTRALTLPALPVIESENVRLAAIKVAEDAGGLILRLAEYHGREAVCSILMPDWAAAASVTDMSETLVARLTPEKQRLTLLFKPYEVVTVYLHMQAAAQ